jgi:hypothetical protein
MPESDSAGRQKAVERRARDDAENGNDHVALLPHIRIAARLTQTQ